MTAFTKLQKQYRWPDIEIVLNQRIGEEKTSDVFLEATQLSQEYEKDYRHLKGYKKKHAAAAYNIAALYRPLRDVLGKHEAIEIIDEVWKVGALEKKEKYDRIPPSLLMLICRLIVKKAFGNEAGFIQEDRSANKKEVRFDILSCPYVTIMKAEGCEEACPLICRQDEYSYGGLRRVSFERTKTLGRGDELCDFCFRIK